MNKIRVLIVDDHPVVRRGLRGLLSVHNDLEVVAEAEDSTSALAAVGDFRPDVIVLDIRLPGPDGIEAAYQLRQLAPDAKIIVLTAYDSDEYVMNALRAGVYAYLQKSSSDKAVVEAIRLAHSGKRSLSPALVDPLIRNFQTLTKESAVEESGLTDSQARLIKLMAAGASNAEIAKETFWSERTVKRQIQQVFAKLNVSNRAQAVAEAMKRGLI